MVLGLSAFRTSGGFFCCLTFFGGQGEELFALPAWANFEVGDSLIVDIRGQEQLQRVIPDRAAIGKFDDGQTVVKDLERSFLPFSGQDMPEDQHRLPLTLRAEVSQGMLGVRGARELACGAGSEDWCRHHVRSRGGDESPVSHG